MRFLQEISEGQLLVSTRSVEENSPAYKKYEKLIYYWYFILMPFILAGILWRFSAQIPKSMAQNWIAALITFGFMLLVYGLGMVYAVKRLDNWTEIIVSEEGMHARFADWPHPPGTQDIKWDDFKNIRFHHSVVQRGRNLPMGVEFFNTDTSWGSERGYIRFFIWPSHYSEYRVALIYAIKKFRPNMTIVG